MQRREHFRDSVDSNQSLSVTWLRLTCACVRQCFHFKWKPTIVTHWTSLCSRAPAFPTILHRALAQVPVACFYYRPRPRHLKTRRWVATSCLDVCVRVYTRVACLMPMYLLGGFPRAVTARAFVNRHLRRLFLPFLVIHGTQKLPYRQQRLVTQPSERWNHTLYT